MSNPRKNSSSRRLQDSPWGSDDMLVVCAFRYCLGRQTYIVQEFVDWLLPRWDKLGSRTKELIQKELEAAVVSDERARTRGDTYKPMWADCDKKSWLQLRSLWSQPEDLSDPAVLAKKYLGIETLETRKSDSLDFHEVAVWGVRSALTAAYQAGAAPVSHGEPGLVSEKVLEAIAKEHLGIDTLEERKSSLDFHPVAVWAVQAALISAAMAGAAAALSNRDAPVEVQAPSL